MQRRNRKQSGASETLHAIGVFDSASDLLRMMSMQQRIYRLGLLCFYLLLLVTLVAFHAYMSGRFSRDVDLFFAENAKFSHPDFAERVERLVFNLVMMIRMLIGVCSVLAVLGLYQLVSGWNCKCKAVNHRAVAVE